MKKNEVYHYYVEGHDEKKIVDILKRDMGCIKSGKVDIFNAVQNRFSEARIRTLKSGTIVVAPKIIYSLFSLFFFFFMIINQELH